MKKVLKILIILLAIFFMIGAIAFIAFSIDGYNMYQEALKVKSMDERIEEIRSKERLCYH